MKVRALRLAEVGLFSTPVALEGFSGGLDVLTGANETGKSTLYTALATLIAERHTSTARTVASLRPDAGGAPLIEADIQIGQRLVRLRKRFLAQRTARLEDLETGEIWHGADAEAAAEQLLGGDGRRAMRDLLWVAQGQSFALPEKPDAALGASLASLIESEAANAAGAGHLRRLGEQVRARLELLVTGKTGKARANGPLERARRTRDELAARLEIARAKAAAASSRLEQRQALAAERAAAAGTEVAGALVARADATRVVVEQADKARERLRSAVERVRTVEVQHREAQSALDRHAKLAAEASRLDETLASGANEIRTLLEQRDAEVAHLASARSDLTAAETALKTARQALQAAHAASMRRTSWAAIAEIDRRLAQARTAAALHGAAETRLAGNAVTEASVEAIRKLQSRLDTLDARIAAEQPRATIAYQPGRPALIHIDGVAVADGAYLSIERRTVLVIEGVGTITLEPGLSLTRSPATDRASCISELTRTLEQVGVADLAAAEARLTQRRRDESEAATARASLASVAPDGLAALEALRSQTAAKAGTVEAPGAAGTADIAHIEDQVRTLEAAVAEARTTLTGVESKLNAHAATIARQEARLAANERRRVELASELPVATESEGHAEALQAAVRTTATALGEAVRDRTAWTEAALQGPDYDAVVAEAMRAADALAQHSARRSALDREISSLDGALRRDGEDGTGSDVPGLEEEFAVAQARIDDLELDVDALDLLATRLEQAGADHREQFLRPLIDRLQPLLCRLLPDARLAMEGPLLAVRLERTQRHDPLTRISGGTREQIATLVRLAYADLMAARGIDLPLVLDDPLVFSDDQRLEIMVELLAAAARRHQVIVLSCHQRALDPLVSAHSACQLSLTPWTGSGDAQLASPKTQKSRASGSAPSLLQV